MVKTINQYPGLCISCGHWKSDCYAKRCSTCRKEWGKQQKKKNKSDDKTVRQIAKLKRIKNKKRKNKSDYHKINELSRKLVSKGITK